MTGYYVWRGTQRPTDAVTETRIHRMKTLLKQAMSPDAATAERAFAALGLERSPHEVMDAFDQAADRTEGYAITGQQQSEIKNAGISAWAMDHLLDTIAAWYTTGRTTCVHIESIMGPQSMCCAAWNPRHTVCLEPACIASLGEPSDFCNRCGTPNLGDNLSLGRYVYATFLLTFTVCGECLAHSAVVDDHALQEAA